MVKAFNNALFHTKLARQRSITVRISIIYLDLLYVYSLLRKQHVKYCPPADRLDCRISIKMASQHYGGIIANNPTHCVHSQLLPSELHSLPPDVAYTKVLCHNRFNAYTSARNMKGRKLSAFQTFRQLEFSRFI